MNMNIVTKEEREMENAIHVGNKIDKDSADNLKNVITSIFESGHKNHMDQNTIIEALQTVAQAVEVKNVTITNSSFEWR